MWVSNGKSISVFVAMFNEQNIKILWPFDIEQILFVTDFCKSYTFLSQIFRWNAPRFDSIITIVVFSLHKIRLVPDEIFTLDQISWYVSRLSCSCLSMKWSLTSTILLSKYSASLQYSIKSTNWSVDSVYSWSLTTLSWTSCECTTHSL